MENANLLILVAFFGIMYFTLIRPQKKRQKEHQQMVRSVGVGDDVVTIGGVHGRIVGRDTDTVDLQVSSDGTVIRFTADAVRAKVDAEATDDEPDLADADDGPAGDDQAQASS